MLSSQGKNVGIIFLWRRCPLKLVNVYSSYNCSLRIIDSLGGFLALTLWPLTILVFSINRKVSTRLKITSSTPDLARGNTAWTIPLSPWNAVLKSLPRYPKLLCSNSFWVSSLTIPPFVDRHSVILRFLDWPIQRRLMGISCRQWLGKVM